MFLVKFFKLSNKPRPIVTGGHVYDNNLLNSINKSPDIKAENTYLGTGKKIPKPLLPLIEFFKGIKNRKADVIVFNSASCLHLLPLAVFLRIFSRNRKIHTIHHHFIYLEFSGLKRKVYKTAESLFLKSADTIIVPSPYIYAELKKRFKEEKLKLLKIPFESKQEYIPKPISGNLTFAGTIEPRKGLKYLFEALKILQDRGMKYNLNILGKVINEGYYLQLTDYAATHKLNVNFMGFVEKDEKNRILSQSDLFVFPSLLEGFGMVLVEAQVYGLPIIAFDNSAMPFTVKNDVNGYTVTTKDVEAMADKIEEVITNRPLREKLSKGALENLKDQWTQEKFETEVKKYYEGMRENL